MKGVFVDALFHFSPKNDSVRIRDFFAAEGDLAFFEDPALFVGQEEAVGESKTKQKVTPGYPQNILEIQSDPQIPGVREIKDPVHFLELAKNEIKLEGKEVKFIG